LVDANNTMPYVGYILVDLTGAPFSQPGFLSFCTGALVNPRMVISAAHCFNSAPESAYGTGGTVRSAVSFSPYPLANSMRANWLTGAPLLNGQPSNGFTDIASIRYAPSNVSFWQADIAVISLANTVSNIPGTPLLMSPLDSARDGIIAGYGRTGTGTTGVGPFSSARRIGQNSVDALLSINDLCAQVAFWNPAECGTFPQNVYMIDFDSLTTSPGIRQNPYDFDVLPGASLPREAQIGNGDSGGSLFATVNGTQVSLGPLSGNIWFSAPAQNFGSYGTLGFWQPAFLFANWIATENPERYFVANAGNFSWTSPAAWQEMLDPGFLMISGSTLVNGIPATDIGIGPAPDIGAFNDGSTAPATQVLDGGASASFAAGFSPAAATFQSSSAEAADEQVSANAGAYAAGASATPPAAPRPVGTFSLTPVAAYPNNINATNTTTGRYFDVTLRNTGTVTLSGLSPTIDRLTINGAGARLVVDPGNALTSLISPELWAGNLTVNGSLVSAHNIWQLGGTLQGAGTVQAGANGALMVLGGTVAPGNSIGTLNVSGPYFQGADATLAIEMTNGSSDLLNVSGNAMIDGTVRFSSFGPLPLPGHSYDFLTTSGLLAGTFDTIQDLLPGALFPIVSYGPNFANVRVANWCYFASNAIQNTVCATLDNPATQTDPEMAAAIAQLQLLDPTLIPQALEAFNPTRAHAQSTTAFTAGDLLRNQFGRRAHDLSGGSGGSGVAKVDLTSRQLAAVAPSADILASAALAALSSDAGGGAIELPHGYGLYFAADVAITKTEQAALLGEDEADVAALTMGLDHSDDAGFVAGLGVSYLQSNVDQSYGLGGRTSSDGLALSGYGSIKRPNIYLDVYLSYGLHSFETERSLITAPAIISVAEGKTDARQFQAGGNAGYTLHRSESLSTGLVGGLNYIGLDIDAYAETGAGALGAALPDRSVSSLRTQLGGEVALYLSPESHALVPILRAVWNHEFIDDASVTSAGFAGGPAVTFTSPGSDLGTDWATVGAGLTGRFSHGSTFYFRYQHDLGRRGQQNHEISAAARFVF
jgi:uncharacterized protein with beta-barrel porin domain